MYNECLSALIKRAKSYLYGIEGCKESMIERRYGYLWNRMLNDVGDVKELSKDNISRHCISFYGKDLINLDNQFLNLYERIIKKSLLTLLYFKTTGEIIYIPMEKRSVIIDDYSAKILEEYNQYQRSMELKETTINSKEEDLKYFLRKYPLSNLSEENILEYIASLTTQQPYSARLRMNKIKNFLKYAKAHSYINNDFKYLFPTHPVTSTGSIASSYSNDEILKVVNSYKDSEDPCCKRNYAIVLILATYGLRARDITLLSIDNINWDKNTIKIITSKTNITLEYSLSTTVGNAIIDYILNERPKTSSRKIFLLKNGNEITSNIVTSIVNKAFTLGNININNKHYGAHSLRASLATRMLTQNTSIFTISKVLGHASIDTTKLYTKVDIPHLRLCELEVIPYEL